MKLSLKFALSFLLGIGGVLAVHFSLRIKREVNLFDQDFRQDHETMGRDLAAAVKRIWQTSGESSATAFVQEANDSKSNIQIRWIGQGQLGAIDAPSPILAAEFQDLHAENRILSRILRKNEGEFLYTFVPVSNGPVRLGTLELAESLTNARTYVRSSITRQVVATAIIVAITGLIALVLGMWIVGRPVRLLVASARRIAAGDYDGTVNLSQSDELGELAREINVMSNRLAEASARVHAEIAAKIEAIEQLRHADRLRTVGQLTSGIAHELGTPINVVWARAKLISNDPANNANSAHAKVIIEQSSRMTSIIRRVLDYSRKSAPKKSRIDLGQVIRNAVALLRPTLEGRPIVVAVNGSAESIVVEIDVDQLQQVVFNLVINAIQSIEKDGQIQIELGRRFVRNPFENAQIEHEFAYFSVKDSGCGITPENLSQVFDPFYTTKDVGAGTGLGLSISLEIVRDHGGWIDVESRIEEGALFTVYIPYEAD